MFVCYNVILLLLQLTKLKSGYVMTPCQTIRLSDFSQYMITVYEHFSGVKVN